MPHPGYRPIPISATMALNSWLMRESCCRNTLLQKHHARELRTAGAETDYKEGSQVTAP